MSFTDGTNTLAAQTTAITVTDANDAPTWSTSGTTTGTENAGYVYTPTTADQDGDSMTITCTTCPDWLDYGTTTADALSGTPDDSDIGANSVVLSVTDGTVATTQSFTVTVANVNDLGSVAVSGTNTEAQVLTATVTDDDGLSSVTITYEWQRSSDASSWSAISGATASTYTLVQADVGNYVRVYVSYTAVSYTHLTLPTSDLE